MTYSAIKFTSSLFLPSLPYLHPHPLFLSLFFSFYPSLGINSAVEAEIELRVIFSREIKFSQFKPSSKVELGTSRRARNRTIADEGLTSFRHSVTLTVTISLRSSRRALKGYSNERFRSINDFIPRLILSLELLASRLDPKGLRLFDPTSMIIL